MDIQKFQTIVPPTPEKLKEDASKISEKTTISTSTNVIKKKKEKKQKKKSRKRCKFAGCRVKLKLTDTECRCKNIYCGKHRLPETHDCLYDYKSRKTESLQYAGLGGGKFEKLTKI